MQLASYLEGGPLIWMMPLHLHVNQKSDYDGDDDDHIGDQQGPIAFTVHIHKARIFL